MISDPNANNQTKGSKSTASPRGQSIIPGGNDSANDRISPNTGNDRVLNPSDGDQGNLASDQRKESQVYTYNAPWTIYSMGFSSRPDHKYRMAIGSFLEDIDNKVEIIQLNDSLEYFEVKNSFTHKYPPTKLMWIPDTLGSNSSDIMATSGETLKIWELKDNKVELRCDLLNNKQIEFSAPLTSFDWYPYNMSLIGTSSIDTTCTIWNIEKGVVYTQLIAHDKEVYDISFSPEENIFASVGADGSARQFDLRNLEHSTVLHETEDGKPLLRLAWNKADPNHLAVFGMDHNYVTILDIRQPMKTLTKLVNHKDCINAIAWAPQSASHICSVGDDCQALIWDLTEIKPELTEPLLEYRAEGEITSLTWSLLQYEWLGISFGKTLQILKV